MAGCGAAEIDDTGLSESSSSLTKGTPGAKLGDPNYCDDPAQKCALGEGDCDTNEQCQTGLVCVRGNLAKRGVLEGDACAPAHCGNRIKDGNETSIDCGGSCGADCTVVCDAANGTTSKCSTDCPCSVGEGDCTSNAVCSTGLVCGANNGAAFGADPGLDFCWGSHCKNAVRDGDETAVDCGGSCGPCTPPSGAAVAIAASNAALVPITIAPSHVDTATHNKVVTAAQNLANTLNAIISRASGGPVTSFTVQQSATPSGITLGIHGDFAGTGWPYQGVFRPDDVLVGGVVQPKKLAQREEYIIWSAAGPNRVLVAGATPDALNHAVWDLLHRIGHRQYFQTPTWEVVPKQPSLSINLQVREKPAYLSRILGVSGSLNGFWDKTFDSVHGPEITRWNERNRLSSSSSLIVAGDTWDDVMESWETRHGQEFPRALILNPALVGAPGSKKYDRVQLCVTGSATITEGGQQKLVTAADAVREFALARPAGERFISISPNQDQSAASWTSPVDSAGNPHCRDGVDAVYSHVPNRIVAMANAAAEVQPQKVISTLAYTNYSNPPTIAVRQNVVVIVTENFSGGSMLTFAERLGAWDASTAAVGADGIWSSINNYDRPDKVTVTARNIIDNLTANYAGGARLYSSERYNGWAVLGPAAWTAARVLWDADSPQSAEAYRNDFLQNAFGPAAADLRAFFDVIDVSPRWSEHMIGTMYRALQQGRTRTSDPAIIARLRDLAQFTRYLELLRRFESPCSAPTNVHGEQIEAEALLKYAYAIRHTIMLKPRGTMSNLMTGYIDARTSVCRAKCPTCGCEPGKGWSDGAGNYCPCTPVEWGVDCPRATTDPEDTPCGTCTDPLNTTCNPTKSQASPTAAEVDQFVTSGVANNAVLPAGAVKTYSSNLVPYTPPNPNLPTVTPKPEVYGSHDWRIWAQAGSAAVTVNVAKLDTAADRDNEIDAQLFASLASGELLVDSKPNAVASNVLSADITLASTHSGLHRLLFTNKGGNYYVNLPSSTHAVLPAGAGDRLALNGRWSAYFYVPQNVTQVAGWSERDGRFVRHYRTATGQWTTSNGMLSQYAVGRTCLNQPVPTNYMFENHFVIPVGADHTSGEVWLFHDNNAGAAGQRALLSVPPYLARSPGQMLAPAETVPAP